MQKTVLLILSLFFYQAQGQNKRALRDFQKAREYVSTEKWEKAEESLRDALKEDPGYMEALLFLADLYRKMGEKEKALSTYQSAYKYNPPYYLDLFYGRLLYELEQYQEAAEPLKRYAQNPRASKRYLSEVNRMIESCAFAQKAKNKPNVYNPNNLGEKVNSEQMEYFPSISADGLTLVFTHRNMEGDKKDEDFWVTTRDSANAPWQKAKAVKGLLNTPRNEGAQAITSDGKVLFFAACERPEGFGSCDIYASFLQPNGFWGKPINLGPQINSGLWESQPSVSPDGLTLYFVRGRDSRAKNLDIYQSTFTSQGWTKAEPVAGNINTSAQETSPFIHFDGQSLYFSSNGHPGMGDLDFFVARKAPDGTWGPPENLGYPINTSAQEFSLIVAPDGKTGFFSSDAMETGFGRLDLYSFSLPQGSQAKAVAYIRGSVIDKKTRKPLAAEIDFSGLTDSTFSFKKTSTKAGKFYAVLPAKSEYALSIEKKGYLFYSQNFKLGTQGVKAAKELLVELIPIAVGQSVKLENVFFDSDSYELDRRSFSELRKVVHFLKTNPEVEVSLEGHTDNVGSAAYNKTLSQNRAEAVYDYLKNKGIEADRLQAAGYGANKPVATNNTDEGRALNRRTEMKITAFR
jgi:outer membrane protein OmpA-like peptidoglycan-associated protein/tetratricopeptide (TPR) repeat protein